MKRGLSYAPLDSAFPSLGLNVLQPSSQANPMTSPKLLNFDVVKGIATKRYGYSQLGGSLDGEVIGIVEYEDLQGVKTLIALTTRRQYKLDVSTDPPTWVEMTRLENNTTAPWTGSLSDVLDYTVATGKNASGLLEKWLIATNGKDNPIYWDGRSARFAKYVPVGISGFQTFQTLKMFFNHLVLANVTSTTKFGQLVAWSDTDSLVNFGGENAGEAIIPGVHGSFQKAELLGDRLFLYSENSITSTIYVGGTAIYSFEQVAQETRLVSGRSIANLGPFHVFLSQENVYLFDGSRLTRTLGDRIFRQYREELSVPRAYEAFAFHDSPRQQVHFVIPFEEDKHRLYKLEYDLYDINSSKWVVHELTSIPRSMGYYSRTSTVTWDSLLAQNTDWQDAKWIWGSGATKKGFPVRLIGFNGEVHQADDTTTNDDGTAVDGSWETVDFTVPQGFLSELARWLEIQLELSGTSCEVYYSHDSGDTYTLAETLTLREGYQLYTVLIDTQGEKIRIKIRNNETSGSLSWRWIRCFYRPGGPSSGVS